MILKKKNKKQNKNKNNNKQAPRAEIEDVEEDMEPLNGFKFIPQRIPARKRPGAVDRGLTKLAWYSGKTIGKVFAVIGNIIAQPFLLAYKGIKKLFVGSKREAAPEAFQKKRDHSHIPGWGGREFQEPSQNERKENDPINVDFRKIPGVWANQIAAEAEDEHGAPLDPVITVYVKEPVEMSDKLTGNNDIGHTFLGLEFSHFSSASNRFERYDTRYGFFAPGGDNISTYVMRHYKNATVPGQLLNDQHWNYTISRSFDAKPYQVNAIMKASETYGDKGYNLYKRNCTTFVHDMVVETAGIRGAEEILKPKKNQPGMICFMAYLK